MQLRSLAFFLLLWSDAALTRATSLPAEPQELLYPSAPEALGSRSCDNRWYRYFHPRPGSFKTVTAGHDHICAIDSRDLLYCWGDGSQGQLGHSDCVGTNAQKPIRTSGLNRYSKVVAGNGFSCALDLLGYAYCWGEGENGVLGDGQKDPHIASYPQPVKGRQVYTDIVAGDRHVCAVDAVDNVFCWGDNSYGQLKHDSKTHAALTKPTLIASSHGIKRVFAGGNTTCGITSMVGLECWGELAKPPESDPMPTAASVQQVSIGSRHVCLITLEQNEVQCWGDGKSGRLGNGKIDGHFVKKPKTIVLESHFSAIAAGGAHTCAIRPDRKAFCWGDNSKGQLGIGKVADQAVGQPTPVAFAANFTSIATGGKVSCGITSEDDLYCWGQLHSHGHGQGEFRHSLEDEDQQPATVAVPSKVHSFPMDKADMDRYCQSILSIDAVTTEGDHPAVLGHNINKSDLNIKGCGFMSPIPRYFADKESIVLAELKKELQGYVVNYGNTGEYVCQFDGAALTDEVQFVADRGKWAIRCDGNLKKKPVYAKTFRLKPGQIAKIHNMSHYKKLLSPKEGICAVAPERENGYVCEPNICEDDKGRYFGAGEQYGEAIAGKPRAVGSECMAKECRLNENNGRYIEKRVNAGATWRWVKDDADQFVCRAINNGCYFGGKFYEEKEFRIKAGEFHFTSAKDNTACSYKARKFRCEAKPSKIFDWVLNSVSTIEGSREGGGCRPVKGCLHNGAKYDVGQTITDSGPIRYASPDDVTHCSFARTTKTCAQRFEGSYYWQTTSYSEARGFRSGDSCVEYDGCYHDGVAYKVGEKRTRNGAPFFESDADGDSCKYELESYECQNQDGVLSWQLTGKINVAGQKDGEQCSQINACIDEPSRQVVPLGQAFKKPVAKLGEGFNAPCHRANEVYVCGQKDGEFMLEYQGSEPLLEQGWTFRDLAKGDGAVSCEQHKNCRDLVAGSPAKHGVTLPLDPPLVEPNCTYYQRRCEHGTGWDLTRNCSPRPSTGDEPFAN